MEIPPGKADLGLDLKVSQRLLFLTLSLPLALSAGTIVVNPDTFSGVIEPNEGITVYLSDYGFLTNFGLLPTSVYSFINADPSSIGAVLTVELLTFAGMPVTTLGVVDLSSSTESYIDTNGTPHLAAIANGLSFSAQLSTPDQQALFSGVCPWFIPASLCTGWFRADLINTGSVPITVVARNAAGTNPQENIGFGFLAAGDESGALAAPPYGGNDAYGNPPSAEAPEPSTAFLAVAGLAALAALFSVSSGKMRDFRSVLRVR